MKLVSAGAGAVQASLYMGSEAEGTVFTSSHKSRTIGRLVRHRNRSLCNRIGIWEIVGHGVTKHERRRVQMRMC